MCDREKQGVSIIVPFLNEEEGIVQFCEIIEQYAANKTFPLEIVFVDDGSTDNTLQKLEEFAFKEVTSVQVVCLSKNFGSHAAIRAGIQSSKYEICTWLGADLQEPLDLIDISFEKITEYGYDAVYVEKNTIKVGKINRFFSKRYSQMMQKYAVKNYSSGGISTIVFNGKVKEYLNNNIENNSSVVLQIMNAGYKYDIISLDFNERTAGKSKWTLSKKFKLLIDSFVSFSYMPIKIVSYCGIVIFFIGVFIGIVTLINKINNPSVPIGYSTLLCVLSIGFGITNISIGIIAEYLWRTFDAARGRLTFIISENKEIFRKEDK